MEQQAFTGITVAILLLMPSLAGCLEDNKPDNESLDNNGLVPVWERVNQNFNTTGSYSYTLIQGIRHSWS